MICTVLPCHLNKIYLLTYLILGNILHPETEGPWRAGTNCSLWRRSRWQHWWSGSLGGPSLPPTPRRFEPKLVAKGCIHCFAFWIDVFASTGNNPVSHQTNCAIIRCRSSRTGKLALEVGGPELHWPLAAFSRFVETSHNQNAWSWMRSYRIGSYLTVSQVPQLTWTAVGWGSWQHNRLPFLLLLAVSGNRAMAMKSVCIVFWMNPQWTPQKHSRMDEQSSCQTELSNKFFSRSKLQDNAIRPWLWGLLTRLIIGPNIVSSSWPLECSRLLYALFLHSCVYTHHSNPSRCANLASVQSAAL